MTEESEDEQMVQEAVGVFDDVGAFEAAIDELQSVGFDRRQISLVAGEHAIEEKLGHIYTRTKKLEDSPRAPRVAYVSKDAIGAAEGALIGAPLYIAAVTAAGVVTAAGGPITAAIGTSMAAAGAGAAMGSILAALVGQRYSNYLQEQLDHGGLILWVHTENEEHMMRAKEVLKRHGASDVHIHTLPNA